MARRRAATGLSRLFRLAVFVLVVGTSLWQGVSPDREGTSAPSAPSGGPLRVDGGPRPSGALPTMVLSGEPKRSGGAYTGTAFALDRAATYATARHVIDDCSRLVVEVGGRRRGVARIVAHARADLAVIELDGGPGEGLVAPDRAAEPGRNDAGYALGYPQGERGALVGSRLGKAAVTYRDGAPALGDVWAVERYPLLADSREIGGISGGPMLDSEYRLSGIIVGSSPRRARAVTINPAHLPYLVRESGQGGVPLAAPGQPLTPDAVDALNAELQRAGLVARVLCLA
ncbi:MAG: serine protease [Azospirillaceae bacterium]